MKRLCALVFCLGMAVMPQANAASLFKDYNVGDNISKFTEQQGYYDCSEEMGVKAKCLDEVPFLGHQFGGALLFSEQNLMAISLFTELDDVLLFKSIGALVKSFSLIALQGSNEILDLIELRQSGADEATASATITNFESIHLNYGQLSYVFIEQPASALKHKKNATEATLSAPRGTRAAEVMVAQGEDDDNYLLINFTSPRLAQDRQEKLMAESDEDF